MIRALIGLVLVGGCARIGDDRFPKRQDAVPADALDVTPDAAGPADAPIPPDAPIDAGPDAP